jgi:hypothetical protein
MKPRIKFSDGCRTPWKIWYPDGRIYHCVTLAEANATIAFINRMQLPWK